MVGRMRGRTVTWFKRREWAGPGSLTATATTSPLTTAYSAITRLFLLRLNRLLLQPTLPSKASSRSSLVSEYPWFGQRSQMWSPLFVDFCPYVES